MREKLKMKSTKEKITKPYQIEISGKINLVKGRPKKLYRASTHAYTCTQRKKIKLKKSVTK